VVLIRLALNRMAGILDTGQKVPLQWTNMQWALACGRQAGEHRMTKTLHGKVHGRTIELDEDPGVAEGQRVQITIQSAPPKKPWGEGLLRCAGALADEWTAEDDQVLEDIHKDRKRDTRREIPE
jgi:hypothetical protein